MNITEASHDTLCNYITHCMVETEKELNAQYAAVLSAQAADDKKLGFGLAIRAKIEPINGRNIATVTIKAGLRTWSFDKLDLGEVGHG